MVADLLEAHQHVHHSSRLIGLLLSILVPDDLIVEVLLSSAHAASDYGLCFLGQLRLHVFLESAEKEWP